MADDALDSLLRRLATTADVADLQRELARLRTDFSAEQARTRRTLWVVAAVVAASILVG